MRPPSVGMSPRSRNAMSSGRVENQYLVGSSSPSGHSISSHSSVSSPTDTFASATRTRRRAKREDSKSAVPSPLRQLERDPLDREQIGIPTPPPLGRRAVRLWPSPGLPHQRCRLNARHIGQSLRPYAPAPVG